MFPRFPARSGHGLSAEPHAHGAPDSGCVIFLKRIAAGGISRPSVERGETGIVGAGERAEIAF